MWLIHQHRAPTSSGTIPSSRTSSQQEDGPIVRDMIHRPTASRSARPSGSSPTRATSQAGCGTRSDARRRCCTTRRRPPRRCSRWSPAPTGTTSSFPSRLEAMKRQQLVIEAMRHVRSDVRLVLVGRGPDEQALRDQIELLRLGDRGLVSRSVFLDERLHRAVSRRPGGLLRAVRRGLRLRDARGDSPPDRPVVTLTDAGGPLEFVDRRRRRAGDAARAESDRRGVRPP